MTKTAHFDLFQIPDFIQKKHIKKETKNRSHAKAQQCACAQLLTVDRGNVVRQVGARRGSAPLDEKLPIGAAMAGHQVIVLCWAGPWWRWRKPKESAFFQMLMGHCEGRGNGVDERRALNGVRGPLGLNQ